MASDKKTSHPDDNAGDNLVANAEKALRMKKEADAARHVPEHRTAGEGEVREAQVGATDTSVGTEATHARNLKRSAVPRVSDGS